MRAPLLCSSLPWCRQFASGQSEIDAEAEDWSEDSETLVVQRGSDLLESSYAELLPVPPVHLHR